MNAPGSKTNRTSRSANQHTIIGKTNKANQGITMTLCQQKAIQEKSVNPRQTNNCLTTKDNTIDYD